MILPPFSYTAKYYDVITIAGQMAPGIVLDVAGASRVNNWDIRKAYGMSGATVVFTGAGLAKFSVSIGLWLPEHFTQWETFAVVLRKRPKVSAFIPTIGISGAAAAVKISHPILAELGILEAVVEEEMALKQVEDGLWSKEVKFIEWRQPVFAIGKPEKADAGPADEKPDKADVMTNNLLGQIDKLSRPKDKAR
jgi:hypothetical protein